MIRFKGSSASILNDLALEDGLQWAPRRMKIGMPNVVRGEPFDFAQGKRKNIQTVT